jgi:hypothetical protein
MDARNNGLRSSADKRDHRVLRLGLTVGILFLAGCAASRAPASDPRLARLDQAMDDVSAREQDCMNKAKANESDAIAKIASAADAFNDLNTRTATSNYYWEVWQCHAEASRAHAQIATSEREEYDLEQKQERDRAALMATLIASRPN